jgi:homopolymeric O-antigen transport system permease protein
VQSAAELTRAGRAAGVLEALARSDIKVRYGRGRLSAIKWLLDPYAAAGVYLLLVAFVLDRPGEAAGLSLACAIVPFQLVMMSIVNALTAIQSRRSIVVNMRFERGLIPFASAVSESVGFFASLTLLAVMMVAYGVEASVAILWLPVLVAVTFVLALSFAYPAALGGLWFPEARGIMLSLTRASFWVAPGVVALNQVSGNANDWLRANPLTGLFEAYRSVFLYGESPAAWQLLLPCAFAAVMLALFVPLFRREGPEFAKLAE